jgi:hypothetical protein
VPERWRRILPLPLAAALYGVLLGLGFTTYVLTFAVWALGAVAFALGSPLLGIAVGAAFGVGRAWPVVALAPLAGTPRGVETIALLAERPILLRATRAVGGAALAAAALTLGASAAFATPATVVAAPATDPSAAALDLAWEAPGVGGMLRRGATTTPLPGHDPAIGGALVAWHVGDAVTVARRDTLAPVLQLQILGLQKLAISDRWLVFRRAPRGGGYVIGARSLTDATAPGRVVARAAAHEQLGRPSLEGDVAVFHEAGPRGSSIVSFDLVSGKERRLLQSRGSQLLNPSLRTGAMLYVEIGRCRQELRLRAHGRERVLASAPSLSAGDRGYERGHTSQGAQRGLCRPGRTARWLFWTTELTNRYAYLTEFRPGKPTAPRLLRLAR